MPQGLTGSPSTYARFGDTAFGALVFEDGTEAPSILGYSEGLNNHIFIYVDDHSISSECDRQPGLLGTGKIADLYPKFWNTARLYSYAPHDLNEIIRSGDALLVSWDLQTLCRQKVDEKGLRYAPTTELGMSTIDLRDARDGIKACRPGASSDEFTFPPSLDNPGDRGMNIRRRINSDHYIVDEYHDHIASSCRAQSHKSSPNQFAYGKSIYVKENDIPSVILRHFQKLAKRNRTDEECKKGILRKIYSITWDSRRGESFLYRVGLLGLYRHHENELNITPLDLQLHEAFTQHYGTQGRHGKNAARACDSLGITTSPDPLVPVHHLHHNAGNDAAFQIEMALALAFLDRDQQKKFFSGEALPFLPTNFVGYTIYEVNKPVPLRKRPASDSTPQENLKRRCTDQTSAVSVSGSPDETKYSLALSDYSWIPKEWNDQSGSISVPESFVVQAVEHVAKTDLPSFPKDFVMECLKRYVTSGAYADSLSNAK